MREATTTLPQFQEYIWSRLPVEKGKLGREVVSDIVSIAVQEWPDEELSQTGSGDSFELATIKRLEESVKRHLQLSYGQDRFGAMWIIAVQLLLPVIVDQILQWWRRRKEHRGRIRIWRRKWVNEAEG